MQPPSVRAQSELCPAQLRRQGYPQQQGRTLTGLGLARDPSLLFSFFFLPFGEGTSILFLSNHCILEAHNMFDFTGSTCFVHNREKFASTCMLSLIYICFRSKCETLDLNLRVDDGMR